MSASSRSCGLTEIPSFSVSARDRTKPLELGASYKCRKLGKPYVVTSAVGTGRKWKSLLVWLSKNYGDGECVSETSFAWVVARPSPYFSY